MGVAWCAGFSADKETRPDSFTKLVTERPFSDGGRLAGTYLYDTDFYWFYRDRNRFCRLVHRIPFHTNQIPAACTGCLLLESGQRGFTHDPAVCIYRQTCFYYPVTARINRRDGVVPALFLPDPADTPWPGVCPGIHAY